MEPSPAVRQWIVYGLYGQVKQIVSTILWRNPGGECVKFLTYDCEVFAHDWIVVFKDYESKRFTVIHNDNAALLTCIDEGAIYCGFASKNYDQYIIKAICAGFTPEEVKEVNDWIIGGGQGWECPLLRGVRFWFNNIDIKDDVYIGHSLKDIEGHLGMNILESDVDFNLDRPLTREELESTIFYCKHDVEATERLVEIRKDYLKTKINLGKRAGIPETKALKMTNAKLTAMMLGAVRKEWTDGREYVYPPNLDLSLIPPDVLQFFETIHDMEIPDKALFKSYHETILGDMPCKYAWGGVHGSVKCFHDETIGNHIIQNRDVSSLYPSLLEEYNYISRNVPDPQLYFQLRKDRIEAKHNGDEQTATDLKTPLNAMSGAQENQYNDLYDPLSTRSMRISGQLFLTMLAMSLLKECKTIKLLNFNTDGLMYSVDKSELPIVEKVSAQWEKTTRFELETDEIDKVWIKDINSLLIIMKRGKVKTVGSYLNYGISVKGAWSINNNAIIVKKALIDYFVKGIPPEDTINTCDDIFQFQIIAKAGRTYRESYHLVDGKKIPVQKVNRIYATTNPRYGKVFKVKADSEDDSGDRIALLPEHCIIDNDNHLTIHDVDKQFYIDLARKRINDFIGLKPEKKGSNMAEKTTPKMNVYQKLLEARSRFLEEDVKKSGKNMKMSYKYFELQDIVPVATPIFRSLGLLPITTFTDDVAMMTMVNVEDPSDCIVFTSPMKEIEPIVSTKTGGEVTNAIQRLGSVETYQRRYLYMTALDIVESDGIDAGTSDIPPVKETPKFVSPEQRKKVTENLTAPDANADDLQIAGLKNAVAALLEKDSSQEDFVTQLAIQTEGFTKITKSDCAAITSAVTEMLEGKA